MSKAGHNFRLLAHHPMWVRVVALYLGLALFGFSIALVLRSNLGNFPWDVLHQGLSNYLSLTVGQCAILVSALVLIAWIPLRAYLRVGLGTISNAILVGVFTDVWMLVVPVPHSLWVSTVFLLSGILLNGIATALYIAPNFGPGPRDGLMTGLVARTGKPVFAIRAVIEIGVMAVGWALGGRLFIGTFLYAFGVGFITQWALMLGERILGPADPLSSDDT